MLAGHRLALALGVVDSTAVLGDDELSRKQLIRAGEAMVDAGLSIVLNRAGTKIPMCTLTAVERKRADQQARDDAAAAGDVNSHKRAHRCGLVHAISDGKTATRVLTRVSKRERFNIGVEPRASRVLIVDVDTARQAAEFALRCGENRPSLTVQSPGKRDGNGTWVHQHGGHIWFDVPDGVELPAAEGIYTDAGGWSAIWGEHQVLVPPSARVEGPYVLVGSTHPLPEWLLDVLITETAARQERRVEAKARRAHAGPSAIDDWAAEASWAEILSEDGWTDTGLVKNCGCPQWTAPGEHASPESATAHEPGCSVYTCERGHGPLHVWTDHPSEAVADAMTAYGTRTLTMLQVLTHTEGDGQMGRTLDELGIERDDGPTVISGPFSTWTADRIEPADEQEDEDSADDPEGDDEDGDDDPVTEEPTVFDAATLFERRVRKELEHERIRREALDRLALESAAALRVWDSDEYLDAPRPDALVPGLLYRDSLARVFGAPGGGKSFLAMDIGLSVALGRFWGGTKLPAEPVVYVMAEGQRVNGDRTTAWLSKHGVDRAALKGWFYVVPDAVFLTDSHAAAFVSWIAARQPGLVILDTKNAMMIGEENSATDFAVMRRTLDLMRKAADCCVVLVDHTGYEGTRARGTSAGTAAMDTEIKVTKDDDQRPSLITAEVTRDKAGEAGATWAWRLMPEHPAAVLVPTDVPVTASTTPEWVAADMTVPEDVASYDGAGRKAVKDLAHMMIFETIPRHDRSQLGLTLTQAIKELGGKHSRSGIQRAWSQLKFMGHLVSTYDTPTETQERSGPHVWAGPGGAPQDHSGDQQ